MFLSPLNFGKPVLYVLQFLFYCKKENRTRYGVLILHYIRVFLKSVLSEVRIKARAIMYNDQLVAMPGRPYFFLGPGLCGVHIWNMTVKFIMATPDQRCLSFHNNTLEKVPFAKFYAKKQRSVLKSLAL